LPAEGFVVLSTISEIAFEIIMSQRLYPTELWAHFTDRTDFSGYTDQGFIGKCSEIRSGIFCEPFHRSSQMLFPEMDVTADHLQFLPAS
jgi:hypothetical protein